MSNHFIKIVPFLIAALIASDFGSESASLCDEDVLHASIQNDLFNKLKELEILRHGSITQMQNAYMYYQGINVGALSEKNKNIFLRGYCKTLIRLGLKNELRKLIDSHEEYDIYTRVTFADALMFSIGDESRAIDLYKEVIRSMQPEISDFKARAYIGLGNARDGGADNINHYRAALELAQDDELRAQAYIGLGNARCGEEQIPYYQEALRLTNDDELKAQAHIGLGNARDGGADNVNHYKEALRLTNNGELKAQAHIGLGNARDGGSNNVKHYQEALRLTKNGELKAQAHIGLGNARHGGGDNVKHYQEALELTKDNELKAQAYIGLGNARYGGVQIPHYRIALGLTQDNELKAQAYIGLGNARDGGADNVNHYKKALELTQDNELKAKAYIGLGNAYSSNRYNIKALKEFINAFNIGNSETKKMVYAILEQKSIFIEADLMQYTGTDKQQLQDWWDNTPDPR